MKKLLKYTVMAMALFGILTPGSAMAWWGGGNGWHGNWHRHHTGYYNNCPVRKVCYHHKRHRTVCNHQHICYVHHRAVYR